MSAIPSVVETYRRITGRDALVVGKRAGEEFFAPCVAPERHKNRDAHPSLRLNPSKDVWCCDPCGAGGRSLALVIHSGEATDEGEALHWLDVERQPVSRVVAQFVYTDEYGKPIARIDRVEPGRNGKDKEFFPYLFEGIQYAGRPGLRGMKLPLYRLDEVRAAAASGQRVFLTEGEGKANVLRDALRANGSRDAVTTIAGGAESKLRDEHLAALSGASQIVVLPDSDEPGRRASRTRTQKIASAHPTYDVRQVDLYLDRSDGADVADWLRDGHTVAELRALVDAAPEYRPLPAGAPPIGPSSTPRLNLRDLRTVRFRRVEWFVTGLVPRAELTLVNGDGGLGKTTAALDLIARATSGIPMPDGLQHDRPQRALIVAEEDRHGLLRARLDVAGVDHEHVRLVESVGANQEFFVLPQHAAALGNEIAEGRFDIVLIDALLSHLDDEINASRPQDMRRALRPLIGVAHESGATILAIRHIGKAPGRASIRGFGSAEARNLCRSELTVGAHPDEDALVVVALSKANLSPNRAATLAFRLVPADVCDDDGLPTTIARVSWQAAPPLISADALLDREHPDERAKRDAAADWLRDYLTEHGETPAVEVCAAAARAGHSRPTLYRARQEAEVVSVSAGFPASARWRISCLTSQVKIRETTAQPETTANSAAVETPDAANPAVDEIVVTI
ncbi:MAG: AAA family ATPase [Candidatus Tyrphobacter sp.]